MHIIAGRHKGRKLLPPPPRSITRPITGHVKKSLFGMLGEDLTGQTVADLYCGTGTMGLEAISRGAEHVYFSERDRGVVDRLRRNIQTFGETDRCTLWRGDVTKNLRARLDEIPAALDLAFVDPPYAHARRWSWERMIDDIFDPLADKLAPDGVVVLRLPDDAPTPDVLGRLAVRRQRRYGTMVLALLKKKENPQS